MAWAESLTHVSSQDASDEQYAALKATFSDTEISDLTFAVSLINAFNRLAVGVRL